MEPAARAEQILVESEAILRDDFVHVTGQHGDGWVAADLLAQQGRP